MLWSITNRIAPARHDHHGVDETDGLQTMTADPPRDAEADFPTRYTADGSHARNRIRTRHQREDERGDRHVEQPGQEEQCGTVALSLRTRPTAAATMKPDDVVPR
jgi:hypothetical protein